MSPDEEEKHRRCAGDRQNGYDIELDAEGTALTDVIKVVEGRENDEPPGDAHQHLSPPN